MSMFFSFWYLLLVLCFRLCLCQCVEQQQFVLFDFLHKVNQTNLFIYNEIVNRQSVLNW